MTTGRIDEPMQKQQMLLPPFSRMMKKSDFPCTSCRIIRNAVESGKKCPATGLWELAGVLTIQLMLSKGDAMPQYYGTTVLWRLVYMC